MSGMMTGPTLRALRSLADMSQAELAEKAAVSATAIAEFETGKRDLRAATVTKLCEAMGVEVSYRVKGRTLSGP
jgi:transcriptional regulator with XRE-family HTH domain